MAKTSGIKRVLIMAGGTGGHVFPGLAVADYLRTQGIDVHWLGTEKGLEAELVPKANIPIHMVNIAGVRRNGIVSFAIAPFKILTAIVAAFNIIQKLKPDIVIGMGGFVSGPGGVASFLTRTPLIIHEQNAIAGLTNKVLAHIAKQVLQAFPDSFPQGKRVLTVGNPVRNDIESLPPPQKRLSSIDSSFNLLILGGSQGAQALNEIVPKAIAELPSHLRPNILHQTGSKLYEPTKNLYASLNVQAELAPFIERMDTAYAWAHMVLCRAGALTVSELCVAGLGAIFVPYPYAVDDHQTANANYLVRHDAAICIQQKDATTTKLADIVRNFANEPQKCVTMAIAAYELRKPQVAKHIFEICQEICH